MYPQRRDLPVAPRTVREATNTVEEFHHFLYQVGLVAYGASPTNSRPPVAFGIVVCYAVSDVPQ